MKFPVHVYEHSWKVQVENSSGENSFKVFLNPLRPMILVASDNLTHFRDLFESSGQQE